MEIFHLHNHKFFFFLNKNDKMKWNGKHFLSSHSFHQMGPSLPGNQIFSLYLCVCDNGSRMFFFSRPTTPQPHQHTCHHVTSSRITCVCDGYHDDLSPLLLLIFPFSILNRKIKFEIFLVNFRQHPQPSTYLIKFTNRPTNQPTSIIFDCCFYFYKIYHHHHLQLCKNFGLFHQKKKELWHSNLCHFVIYTTWKPRKTTTTTIQKSILFVYLLKITDKPPPPP